MSREIDLADAVRDEIANASFAIGFTSVETTDNLPNSHTVARTYLPEYTLAELGYVRLSVVPPDSTRVLAARGARQTKTSIDIVLDFRPTDDDDADAKLSVVEEIKDHFDKLNNPALAGYVFRDFDPQDPVYPVAEEHAQGRLRSAIRLNFINFHAALTA